MINESILLSAYMVVADNRIYHSEWCCLRDIVRANNLDESILRQVMEVFADSKKKISLESVISGLKSKNLTEKKEAIGLALTLACCESRILEEEESFLSDVAKRIGLTEAQYDSVKMSVASSVKTLDDQITITKKKRGTRLYSFLSKIGDGSFAQHMRGLYSQCLLSGEDYSNMIKSMREISKDDIQVVKNSYGNIIPMLEQLANDFDKGKTAMSVGSKDLSTEGREMESGAEALIDSIKSSLADKIFSMKDAANVSLRKKEESLEHYTIAFLGRTKAGKSTLHSIILGGNANEFIGIGKERTTRFNRVYRWNGIEIIDTPGIGAPGGDNDTAIAASVIDEADLICYLVTTDSIQETEFNFLQTIKDQNKPVLVLLNNKDNYHRNPAFYDEFLAHPLKWFTQEGKDSISGHVARIETYVSKYYNNSRVEICPVHLLAAKDSLTETDAAKRAKLYSGSRMQQFLDAIRLNILKYGTVKRSQTIIDGSIFYLDRQIKDFESYLKSINQQVTAFKASRSSSIKKVKEYGQNLKVNMKSSISAVFDEFISAKIPQFALKNRECDSSVINIRLKVFEESCGFKESVSNCIDSEYQSYLRNVQSVLSLADDNLRVTVGGFSTDGLTVKGSRSPKRAMGILGGLLMCAAFVSGGYVLAIAGGILTGISMLLKSKDKKLKEAEERLRKDLSDRYRKYKEKTIKKVDTVLSKNTAAIEASVDRTFDTLISQLVVLKKELSAMKRIESSEFDYLNRVYAARIINFLECETVYPLSEITDSSSISVKRDFGKQMTITTDAARRYDTNEISQVLQETVIINNN